MTSSTQLPQGADKVVAVRSMFDAIAPRYDRVNRLLTLGMDVGWRRSTVRSLGLAPGSLVLDLAAGTGDLCRELTSSGHHAIGLDMALGMLVHARTTAPRVQADALVLPTADATADGVTCGFALRNFVDLGRFFAEAARVLRPGGRLALLEVAQPENPLLRAGHGFYFGRVVPVLGGLLSDRAAYSYLPRSVAYLPAPAELLDMLRRAGFGAVDRRLLSAGIVQLITATRSR